jgi:hypothetical protein
MSTTRLVQLVLLASSLLSACGGGGPDTGACVFAPVDCQRGGSASAPNTSTPAFSRTGSGPSVIALPATVTLVTIRAEFAGTSALFTVQQGGQLVVSTVVGSLATPPTYSGTHAIPAGSTLEITDSNGVAWSVTSATTEPPTGATLDRSGIGPTVLTLPNRDSRYRITGSYSGTSTLFTTYSNDRLLFSSVVGTLATPQSFDGTYAITAGARIEIRDGAGVEWRILETP